MRKMQPPRNLEKYPALMNTGHLAGAFGISQITARTWCETNELPARRIGGRWYVYKENLIKLFTEEKS